MKKPSAPPPLQLLGERKLDLEAKRAELFPRWRAALEAHDGNITKAARAEFIEPSEKEACLGDEDAMEAIQKRAKSYGMWLTRVYGLGEYAAELRVAAGNRSRGRQWKTKE